MIEKGKYKDVSALFQIAFERLMDEEGMSLNIELKELGAKTKTK